MVKATEKAPWIKASFTSSPAPRSSGSSTSMPASFVAASAAHAVDVTNTILFSASWPNLSPPPPPPRPGPSGLTSCYTFTLRSEPLKLSFTRADKETKARIFILFFSRVSRLPQVGHHLD